MLQRIVYSVGSPQDLLTTYWNNRTKLTRFAAGNSGSYLNNSDQAEANTAGWRNTSNVTSTINFTASGTVGYVGSTTTIMVYVMGVSPVITGVSVAGAGTLSTVGVYGYSTAGNDFDIRCNVYRASNPVTSISSVQVTWTLSAQNKGGYAFAVLIPGSWSVDSFNGNMAYGLRTTSAGDFIHTSNAVSWNSAGLAVSSELYESVIPGPGFQLFMGNVVTPNGGTTPCLPYEYRGFSNYSLMPQVIDWAAYWYSHASIQLAVNNSTSDLTASRLVRSLAYSGTTLVHDDDHWFPLWWVRYNGNGNSASMSFRYFSD